MAEIIKDFAFSGIKRIEIPKTDLDFRTEDLGLSVLIKYMPSILSTHRQNAVKIKYLWDYKNGKQDISEKSRLYMKDSLNNNKIVENHASRQVDFKVGLTTSEHRDYTIKADVQDMEDKKSDITYLGRYQTDVNFFGKDKDLKEWIYATGIGVTYTCPRTDLVEKDVETGSYYFRNKEDGFDIESEAPFEFNVVSPIDNFVVYSSSMSKQPLFCVSIVEVEKDPNSSSVNKQKEIHIETRYASFIVNSDLGYRNINDYYLETIKKYHYLPMIEHFANSSRLGLIELNRDLFNCINILVSSVADMVVDNANVILVFKNTDITGAEVQEMKRAGAIIIGDSANARQGSSANLDTIKIEIPFEGLNAYYEQRVSQAYDIAGVPLASGQVTSGGDTGQARLLGGGWNNAYTIAYNDINSLSIGDYDQLKLMLYICSLFPDCPIDKIKASQIDIKYRINQNDNFLVKAQGIQNLYNCNMPKKFILKTSGLSSDIGADADAWDTQDEKSKQLVSETKTNDGNNADNA